MARARIKVYHHRLSFRQHSLHLLIMNKRKEIADKKPDNIVIKHNKIYVNGKLESYLKC